MHWDVRGAANLGFLCTGVDAAAGRAVTFICLFQQKFYTQVLTGFEKDDIITKVRRPPTPGFFKLQKNLLDLDVAVVIHYKGSLTYN